MLEMMFQSYWLWPICEEIEVMSKTEKTPPKPNLNIIFYNTLRIQFKR